MQKLDDASEQIVYELVYSIYREIKKSMSEEMLIETMNRMLKQAESAMLAAQSLYFNEQKAEISYGNIYRATREQFEESVPGSEKFFQLARYRNEAYEDYRKASLARINASDLYQLEMTRFVAIATAIEDIKENQLREKYPDLI